MKCLKNASSRFCCLCLSVNAAVFKKRLQVFFPEALMRKCLMKLPKIDKKRLESAAFYHYSSR